MPMSFRSEIAAGARIETRVATKVGIEVNIGERFTIGLTVRNATEPRDNVVFTVLTVQLLETPYASPVDANGARVAFAEQTWRGQLESGQAQEFLQQFEAVSRIGLPGPFALDPEESVNYKVFVTVDPARMFENIGRYGSARFQIGERHYYCTNPENAHEHATWEPYCLVPIPGDGDGTRLCGYPIPQ